MYSPVAGQSWELFQTAICPNEAVSLEQDSLKACFCLRKSLLRPSLKIVTIFCNGRQADCLGVVIIGHESRLEQL